MANVRKLATYLNSLGITAWGDAGGRGMGASHYEPYRQLADKGELTVRVFWTTIRQPATPEQVDKVLAEVQTVKPFQGNDFMDHIGWGESVYSPITTQLLRAQKEVSADGIKQMQRIAGALAARGIYLNSHVEMNGPSSNSSRRTKNSTRRHRSAACAGVFRISTRSTISNCSA